MNLIDISKWQVSYNAETAKAQGVNDVILRAAYGTSKDTCFDTFYTAAKAAGQTVGAYGFATWHYTSKNGGSVDTARAVMVEQTNAWIAICEGKLDGWFGIDQELESGYSMGLSASDNETLLNECIDMLSAAGFTPCVYCSVSWAMAHFDKDNINADLWLAYYPSAYASVDFADAPNYESMSGTYYSYMQSCGDQLCGWQFGSTGWGAKYGCGSDNLDRNLFYKAAGSTQSSTAFSVDAIQMKLSGYTAENFAEIVTLIGALGIICYTDTLADGYFTTGYASSGDQVTILNKCATLNIEAAPYFAPLREESAMLAISVNDAATFEAICVFVGGMGIVCNTALLDGYIVTNPATPAQQQEILCENLVWGSTIWVYTMPEVTEAEPEAEAEPKAEAEEGEAAPEVDATEGEQADVPSVEASPEDDTMPEVAPEEETEEEAAEEESDKNAQVNALLALIRALFQKVLDLLK